MVVLALCISLSGCQKEKKAESPRPAVESIPPSMEFAARDQPPDSESLLALRSTVAEVIRALRNGAYRDVHEMLVPEIQRAVPFFQFLEQFGVDRNQALELPENLPEPFFRDVRDRVAEVFIKEPDHSKTAVHIDLLRVQQRWFVRSIVVHHGTIRSFYYSGGLISSGSTQDDLLRIKEAMLQRFY